MVTLLIPVFESLVRGRMIGAKIFLKMAQIKSWTVSDALWNKIKRLVSVHKRPRGQRHQRKPRATGKAPLALEQTQDSYTHRRFYE
jgi:hypothetical protein